MQCASIYLSGGQNYLVITSPQPADLSTCTYVVGNYSEFSSGLTQISPEQGAQIAGAILLIWAMGWVIRVIARSLNVGEKEEL